MQATATICILPKPRKDGLHTVYLRVTYNRTPRYFSLGIACESRHFDANIGRIKKNVSNSRAQNDFLQLIDSRAQEAIKQFVFLKKPFNLPEFQEIVFGSGGRPTFSGSLHALMRTHAAEMERDKEYSGAGICTAAALKVEQFDPKNTLEKITDQWFERFEKHLKQTHANKTVIAYVGAVLRSCRKAVKDGIMPKAWLPQYSYSHIPQDTAKRAVTLEQIRLIEKTPAIDDKEQAAKDFFLLSFYLRGINLADLARARWTQVVDGRLLYVRWKTRKKVSRLLSVPLVPQALAILERYRRDHTTLLLPLLADGLTEPQERARINTFGSKVIKPCIQAIAIRAGVPAEVAEGMSYYTARHTFATALKKSGVSVETISELLSHRSIAQTQVYLASFDTQHLDDAAAKIF